MNIDISLTPEELGDKAAVLVAAKLNAAIEMNQEARLLVATGASQLETLKCLVKCQVDWDKVEVFHLDEYINLPDTHPASFRKYLRERFLNLIAVRKFNPVDTEGDIEAAIRTLTSAIRKRPVDVGLIGIGENAHIAFNDPPADFITREAYIRVKLDERCKKQQVGEGWFSNLGEVPDEALSMSVYQIMQCRTIVSAVPHQAKADAISDMFTQKLSNQVPATMLKTHGDYHLFLDKRSASRVITFPDPSDFAS